MSSHPASIDTYFKAWNARGPDAIRRHVSDVFSDTTRYLDPKRQVTGIDEFSACLQAFRATSPDANVTRISGVDSHHDLHRYAWELTVGERSLTGYDVIEMNSDGRINAVLSFFGPLPPLHDAA